MDDARIRAWWFHRQGLDGRLAGQPLARVLEETGWARSVGGASPYLGFLARNGHAAELAAFVPAGKPIYALVAGLDGLLLLRRDVKSLLAPADQDRQIPGEKGAVVAGGLLDLRSHAILDRGRLIGVWEYDPPAAEIVWQPFIPPDAALRDHIRATSDSIRDQLGDARSFSLDSPKSRIPRLAALRAAMPS